VTEVISKLLNLTKKKTGAPDEAKTKIQNLLEPLDFDNYQTILLHGQVSWVGICRTI